MTTSAFLDSFRLADNPGVPRALQAWRIPERAIYCELLK